MVVIRVKKMKNFSRSDVEGQGRWDSIYGKFVNLIFLQLMQEF